MQYSAIMKLLKFLYVQRVRGFEIPTSPFFENASTTEWFVDRLSTCKSYLEYGCGGSTYVAAKFGKPFVTIDSDPYFLAAVKQKIREDGLMDSDRQRFCYADVGMTREWGWPILSRRAGRQTLAKFAKYSEFRSVNSLINAGFYPNRWAVSCGLCA